MRSWAGHFGSHPQPLRGFGAAGFGAGVHLSGRTGIAFDAGPQSANSLLPFNPIAMKVLFLWAQLIQLRVLCLSVIGFLILARKSRDLL